MPHTAAGATAPPRCTWSSVSSSPSGCGIAEGYRRQTTTAAGTRGLGGWHGGAGCARAAYRPRHERLVPSGGERTGRRGRDPDPGTGPAHPAGLAALFARRRTAHSAAAPRTRGRAFGVILPDDVAVVIGGR